MAVPPAPKVVTISELRSTSIKFSSGSTASGLTAWFFYYIRTDGVGGGHFLDATYVQSGGDIFAAVATGLTPDKEYSVSACNFNADGQGPYSAARTFTTLITFSVPPAQTASDIIADTITSSSILVHQLPSNVYGRPEDDLYQLAGRETDVEPDTWTFSAEYMPVTSARNFTGLKRATSYTFRARVHNEAGWSTWAGDKVFTTLATVPDQSDTPIFGTPGQNSVTVTMTDNSNGGSTILERQLQWGTDGVTFPNTWTLTGTSQLVTNLTAGHKIYFRGRTRNAIGWSTYTNVASVKLVAGAWVRYAGVWKEAVPWVRVSGVWKTAKPWVRIAGAWKGVK